MPAIVKDLTREPVVGEQYLVTVAISSVPLDGTNIQEIPILDDQHFDCERPEFGDHYHVDLRFLNEELSPGLTFPVAHVSRTEDKSLICQKRMPDLPKEAILGLGEKYQKSKIKCNRCPHQGTYLGNLPADNGIVICPAHGLRFDLDTGKATQKRRKPIR